MEPLYTVCIKLLSLPHLSKKRGTCSTYCLTSLTHACFPLTYQPTYLSNQSTHIFPPTHPPTQPSTPFHTNLSICPTSSTPTHLMHTSIHHQSPPHLSIQWLQPESYNCFSQNTYCTEATDRSPMQRLCPHLAKVLQTRPSGVNGYSPHQSPSPSVHSYVCNDNQAIIFGSEICFGLVTNQCSIAEYHTGQ